MHIKAVHSHTSICQLLKHCCGCLLRTGLATLMRQHANTPSGVSNRRLPASLCVSCVQECSSSKPSTPLSHQHTRTRAVALLVLAHAVVPNQRRPLLCWDILHSMQPLRSVILKGEPACLGHGATRLLRVARR